MPESPLEPLITECPNCHTVDEILKPLSQVSFEAAHCPTCGLLRETTMTHQITGDEPFLHRTLSSVGIPPLHIIRANNGQEYRFYELTGDLNETLHFHDFDSSVKVAPRKSRVRLKGRTQPAESAPLRLRGSNRIRLRD